MVKGDDRQGYPQTRELQRPDPRRIGERGLNRPAREMERANVSGSAIAGNQAPRAEAIVSAGAGWFDAGGSRRKDTPPAKITGIVRSLDLRPRATASMVCASSSPTLPQDGSGHLVPWLRPHEATRAKAAHIPVEFAAGDRCASQVHPACGHGKWSRMRCRSVVAGSRPSSARSIARMASRPRVAPPPSSPSGRPPTSCPEGSSAGVHPEDKRAGSGDHYDPRFAESGPEQGYHAIGFDQDPGPRYQLLECLFEPQSFRPVFPLPAAPIPSAVISARFRRVWSNRQDGIPIGRKRTPRSFRRTEGCQGRRARGPGFSSAQSSQRRPASGFLRNPDQRSIRFSSLLRSPSFH